MSSMPELSFAPAFIVFREFSGELEIVFGSGLRNDRLSSWEFLAKLIREPFGCLNIAMDENGFARFYPQNIVE